MGLIAAFLTVFSVFARGPAVEPNYEVIYPDGRVEKRTFDMGSYPISPRVNLDRNVVKRPIFSVKTIYLNRSTIQSPLSVSTLFGLFCILCLPFAAWFIIAVQSDRQKQQKLVFRQDILAKYDQRIDLDEDGNAAKAHEEEQRKAG